ncbi:hypothetical protein QCA50_002060 [Cerrena zonata]|uniref:Uncharacterized protein n=1 Tax=Cerrena zonata TaxID=2478898 RepID=A0AAW0GX66_9APHY
MHAPELIGACPSVPVVVGDEDIPIHPTLGTELSLPALLRLPTLKTLRIRDTHLGDPRWAETPVYCSLQVLDLGSCYHESPDFNRICTERIVNNVGHTIDDLSLNTAITGDSIELSKPESPLKKLRKIQLTPLFPVENVVDTLTTLSDSPIEQLSVRCHQDDIEDICNALEDFLSSRVERGETALHKHLKDIIVDPVQNLDDAFTLAKRSGLISLNEEQTEAVRRVQEYLRDLRLAGDAQTLESCSEILKGASGKQVAGLLAATI